MQPFSAIWQLGPRIAEALRSPVSVNRRIFRAVMVVGALSAMTKLVATGKELAVAGAFGRGDAVDAFFIAFLVPSVVVNLVSGSLNAALIPTFIQVRDTQGPERAHQVYRGTLFWSLLLLMAVAVVLAATSWQWLPLLASHFSPQKLRLAHSLLLALLPFVVLNGAVVTWASILNAGERFTLPAISPVLGPVAILVCLLLRVSAWGIWALVVGTLAGAAIEAVVLAYALKRRALSVIPAYPARDPFVRQVARQWAPLLAGSFLASGISLVDQSMAAMLAPGSVAALNYAGKIVSVITAISSTALSTAVLPYFSQMVAKRDWVGCRRTLLTYARLIAWVTIPLTALLAGFSQPLIRTLFQRGAFTATDTLVVARTQMFYVLQIPFYAIGILLVRLLSSLKRNDLLLYGAAINVTADIIFNLVLMRWYGVAGIALSTSMFYVVACIFFAVCVYRVLRRVSAEAPALAEAGVGKR